MSSALNVARGNVKPMDLMYVETAYMTRLCVTSITWGIVADIDIDSEAIRFIGEPRFRIYAVMKIMKSRKYRAKLSYIPVSRDEVDQKEGIVNKVFDEGSDTQSILKQLHQRKVESDPDASSEDEMDETGSNEEDNEDKSDETYSEKGDEDDETPTVEIQPAENGVQPPQPPGTYLVPRAVSYGTMLAQGQLYFRSWQELQTKVMRKPPPPEQMPLQMHPSPDSINSGPTYQPSGSMPPPCPKHGYQLPMHMQQKATATSSLYSTAAAALKRYSGQSKKNFDII